MNKVKAGFSAVVSFVKSHPIAAVITFSVFAMFLAVPLFRVVNNIKAKVPGANKVPDLTVKS